MSFENPTFAEAKKLRKRLIGENRKGDKVQRLVADALAQCRRSNRCNAVDCPVCDRRRRRLFRHNSPSGVVKSVIGNLRARIYLSGVEVGRNRRPLNEAKVQFIASSMREIGQQVPIIVRLVGKKLVLVSGWHRLEAARRLGWESILVLEMTGDKLDARLVEITENLHRAELTVLQRSEHIDEWRRLILKKVGQVAPPGGRQPKNAGIKRTARELGLTREEVRHSKDIAGILRKAKAAAIKLGLDNSQRALLAIAEKESPKEQVNEVLRRAERKAAARARRAVIVADETKIATAIKVLEADIAGKAAKFETAKDDLADQRRRLRELQDGLAVAADRVAPELAAVAITSPPTSPTQDQDTSAIQDSDPTSAEDEEMLVALNASWNEVGVLKRDDWQKASGVVREQFAGETLQVVSVER